MTACLAGGGTIAHDRGVGLRSAALLSRELGSGTAWLAAVKRAVDPTGVLNPGKVMPAEPAVSDREGGAGRRDYDGRHGP